MGHADYFLSGSNNVICDQCGKKYKAKSLKKQWDGIYTCSRCWDYRNPQEYVRGVPDSMAPTLSRPEAPNEFTEGAQNLLLPDSPITPPTPPDPPSNTLIFSFTSTGIPSATSAVSIGTDTNNYYVIGLTSTQAQFALVIANVVVFNTLFNNASPEGNFVVEHDTVSIYLKQNNILIDSETYTEFIPTSVIQLTESAPNTITNIIIG